jgi:hypothetical protein
MIYGQLALNLALIFSETCFQVLLYFCVIGLLKGQMLVSPWYFFLLTGVLTAANFFIAMKSWRIITIVLFNLLLVGIVVWLMTFRAGLPEFYLVSIPQGIIPAVNVILADCSIGWLGFRSLLLAYRRKPVQIYSHFDIYILLSLAVFLTLGIAGNPLPGGMAWAIVAVCFNLIPLYIHSNTGNKPPYAWMLVLPVIALLYFASRAVPVLALVSEPAGAAFDFLRNVFTAFAQLIGNIILFFVRIMHGRGGSFSPAQEDTQSQSGMTEWTTSDLSWMNAIWNVLLWVIVIAASLFVLFLLYTLTRYLVVRLLKRRVGNSRATDSAGLFLPWKNIRLFLRRLVKKAAFFLLPFLPFKISVVLAYRLLLQWGIYQRCPRGIDETPYDYCRRLSERYPGISRELEKITEAFVIYRYAEAGMVQPADPSSKLMIRRIYMEGWRRSFRYFSKRKPPLNQAL